MTCPRRKRFKQSQGLFETAADAVAPDRSARLLGYGETKPWWRLHAGNGTRGIFDLNAPCHGTSGFWIARRAPVYRIRLRLHGARRRLQSQSMRVKAFTLRSAQEVRPMFKTFRHRHGVSLRFAQGISPNSIGCRPESWVPRLGTKYLRAIQSCRIERSQFFRAKSSFPRQSDLKPCRSGDVSWSARQFAPGYYAESRLRPRARRAAITLRPPTVDIRARNPCLRLRTSLLGW